MVRRILLVDDEEDIREIGRLSLEMVAGWEVHTAADGESAVSVASGQQPDAILLDVMMPGLDGPGVVQLLRDREDTREIPVVLLTAKTQASDLARFTDLAVSGVLSKPFDPMALAGDLAATLGWSAAPGHAGT